MLQWVFLVYILAAMLQGVYGTLCSDYSASNTVSWASLDIATNASVVIAAGDSVMYDDSTALQVDSILVQGTLVFADVDVDLSTKWILVEDGGALILGLPDCPLTQDVVITFVGARPEALNISDMGYEPEDDQAYGSKGLAVAFGGLIQIHGSLRAPSWTLLTANAEAGSNTLYVQDAVTWVAGDQLALASTDFGPVVDFEYDYPEQTELVTVADVLDNGYTVVLTEPLAYPHHGTGHMQAEVALLSRNVKLQGDAQSEDGEFGAHMMIRGAVEASFSAAEFYRMGQKGVVGRYPVHFHQMGTPPDDTYVKDCSVWRTFQRCYVIHDTSSITLENNVGYDSAGHCYFLEDGSEENCTLTDNVAIQASAIFPDDPFGQIIPSDDEPSMFWIVNPQNTFVGNHASGGAFGFWFAMPEKPNGRATEEYADLEGWDLRNKNLQLFQGNVAHGADQNGLMVDEMQEMDGTIVLASYHPEELAYFDDFIAYKCRENGIWARGDNLVIRRPIVSDCTRAVLCPPGATFIVDAVIMGETDNVGTGAGPTWLPAYNGNRSRPVWWTNNFPLIGVSHYDAGGPQFFTNISFSGFFSDDQRHAAAMGVLHHGPFMLHPRNQWKNIQFLDDSDKLYIPSYPNDWCDDCNYTDTNMGVNFLDVDGSITDYVGGWVVGQDGAHFMLPDAQVCDLQTEERVYYCPSFGLQHFINIAIADLSTSPVSREDVIGREFSFFYRHGLTAESEDRLVIDSDFGGEDADEWKYSANLLTHAGYHVGFPHHATPDYMSITPAGHVEGDWTVYSFNYPEGTTFELLRGYDMEVLAAAASKEELTHDTPWYFEGETLFVLFNPIGQHGDSASLQEAVGFAWQRQWDNFYVYITATCPADDCAVSSIQVPEEFVPVAMAQDVYRASLDVCEAGVEDENVLEDLVEMTGFVYLGFNPTSKQFSYYVHHNAQDAADTTTTTAETFDIDRIELVHNDVVIHQMRTVSPSRDGGYVLPRSAHEALFNGELEIVVYPVAGDLSSSGVLRGTLGCTDSSCSEPENYYHEADVCAVSDAVAAGALYRDARTDLSNWLDIYGENRTVAFEDTTVSACGTTSLRWMQNETWGAIHSGIRDVNVSDYDAFSFLIMNNKNYGVEGLQLGLETDAVTGYSTMVVDTEHISDYVIQGLVWNRVVVPFTAFEPALDATASFRKYRIALYQSWTTGWLIDAHLDDIMFVNMADLNAEYTLTTPALNLATFSTPACAAQETDTGDDDDMNDTVNDDDDDTDDDDTGLLNAGASLTMHAGLAVTMITAFLL